MNRINSNFDTDKNARNKFNKVFFVIGGGDREKKGEGEGRDRRG